MPPHLPPSQIPVVDWLRFFICAKRGLRVRGVCLPSSLPENYPCHRAAQTRWSSSPPAFAALPPQEIWSFPVWGKGVKDHYHPPAPLLRGEDKKAV